MALSHLFSERRSWRGLERVPRAKRILVVDSTIRINANDQKKTKIENVGSDIATHVSLYKAEDLAGTAMMDWSA